MRRFFVNTGAAGSNKDFAPQSLTLEESEAYHAARVLRAQPGDELWALDGQGHQFTCRVLSVSKSRVELGVEKSEYRDPLPWSVTLAQALPKGGLMEDIVQKATELGVSRIVPLLSQRTEVRVSTERDAAAKVEKWNTIAKESCKQCGGLWLPQVERPCGIKEWLAQRPRPDLSFVASLETVTRSHHFWFRDFQEKYQRPARTLEIWVGPEGDFTPEEYELLRQNGALPTTLGPLVLRCATAAISSVAIALAEAREQI